MPPPDICSQIYGEMTNDCGRLPLRPMETRWSATARTERSFSGTSAPRPNRWQRAVMQTQASSGRFAVQTRVCRCCGPVVQATRSDRPTTRSRRVQHPCRIALPVVGRLGTKSTETHAWLFPDASTASTDAAESHRAADRQQVALVQSGQQVDRRCGGSRQTSRPTTRRKPVCSACSSGTSCTSHVSCSRHRHQLVGKSVLQ